MSTTPIDRSTCKGSRHGDNSAYRLGCRCPDAREDKRLYLKRRREGRQPPKLVDGTGTARRLQALGAIGWPSTELGARLGVTRIAVQNWRREARAHVNHRTATRIARLYDQLSATPGPSDYTRSRARSFGWVAPPMWEDIDIDDPNSQPEAPAPETGRRPVTVLVENFDDLVSKGLSEAQAAARLGIKPESIGPARKRARESAARKAQIARKQAVA